MLDDSAPFEVGFSLCLGGFLENIKLWRDKHFRSAKSVDIPWTTVELKVFPDEWFQDYLKIYHWLDETCGNDWNWKIVSTYQQTRLVISIKKPQDAILFKLTFG